MWPFGVVNRVSKLEEHLDSLERSFKALELDWNTVYDKLRKAMGRMVKSQAIMERAAGEERGDEQQAPTAGPQPITGFLTDRQKAVQQSILRRRAGG